jgi:hypothetical protein
MSLPRGRKATIEWWRDVLLDASKVGTPVYYRTKRLLGANDLFFLLVRLLHRPDVNRDWLFERCREVQAEPDGCLDLWAREHYKSTIITFGHSILDVIRDQEVTIGLFSHTRPIAKAFLRQIKTELEMNTELIETYPDIFWARPDRQSPKWSEDDGLIVRRRSNPKEATIEAWGLVDGQPTSRHFDKRVYDDAVTDKSVTTPEMVLKTTRALDLSQNLRSSKPGASGRYIGTRYSYADSYQVLIDRRTVKVRRYPATHDGTRGGRPVLLTEAQWEAHKRDQPLTLAAQMLQNPAQGLETIFKMAWPKPYWTRPSAMHVYMIGDPSAGRSKKADSTAIPVIGLDSSGNKYLLDGFCHRMNLTQRWEALLSLWERWTAVPGVRLVRVGWESYGMQADMEHFEHMMRLTKKAFPITEVNWPNEGPHAKVARMGRLVPDLERGNFFFPAIVRLENEHRQWRLDEVGQMEYFNPVALARETVRYEMEQAGKPEAAIQVAEAKIKDPPRGTYPGEPKRCQELRKDGLGRLVMTPIVKLDADGQAYDLTQTMFEQMQYIPFAPHDDLVDAASRIYDMDPVAPAGERNRGYGWDRPAYVDE